MKPLLVFFLSLVSVASQASWETIKGNGNLKKETRSAAGYTGIQLQGSMNVQIAYGNSDNISVEGDENLLPYIETFVENGNLIHQNKKQGKPEE